MPEDLRVTPPAPTPPGPTPLDWRVLVNEALRRRKAEGLTQKQHAALAGVSVPTMVAFDRGETTLSLAKAFDILDVVGLLAKAPPEGTQARFVRDAMERWRTLVEQEPAGSPARFEHGWFRVDYWLDGDLRIEALDRFAQIVDDARLYLTGWPMFQTAPNFPIQEVDGTVECWLSPDETKRFLKPEPAYCDFWRATSAGRMLLVRGYQEDGADTFPPGRIFDITLPIWRLGEALLHAERMAKLMSRDGSGAGITIHFRATYTGLAGRVLKNWANPLSEINIEGHAALGDEAVLETATPAEGLSGRLLEVLFPLLETLYARFGVGVVSMLDVDDELQRMLKGRV